MKGVARGDRITLSWCHVHGEPHYDHEPGMLSNPLATSPGEHWEAAKPDGEPSPQRLPTPADFAQETPDVS